MKFPIYRRPGGVVFLDDDPAYLEMLAEVMPEHWPVRLFTRPADCIRYLEQEPAELEADSWRHKDILDRWHNGQNLIAQILSYWREAGPWRFGLSQVCVVDYSMPAMNGLQVLERLAGWPGARVLLTGRADEQIAVAAFNASLIEQYVPKQASEISRRLARSIQQLLDGAWGLQAQAWRASLSREQMAVKRGVGLVRTQLTEGFVQQGMPLEELLSLDDALRKLEAVDPELAELVEWHFFAGLSFVEIAEVRGVTERTVRRHWDTARAFLLDALPQAAGG